MRTIRTKVYLFNELSEEAKQVAINANSYINVEHFDWWQSSYEDAENVGLKITSFDLDRNKHANGHFINGAYFTANKIIENHGEECETFKIAKAFIDFWDKAVKLHSDGIKTNQVEDEKAEYFDEYVADYEEKFLKYLLKAYADILETDYDYRLSDEAIKETLIANEYEFTQNGNLF